MKAKRSVREERRWNEFLRSREAEGPPVTPKVAELMVEIAMDEASREPIRGGGRRVWAPYPSREAWEIEKKRRAAA